MVFGRGRGVVEVGGSSSRDVNYGSVRSRSLGSHDVSLCAGHDMKKFVRTRRAREPAAAPPAPPAPPTPPAPPAPPPAATATHNGVNGIAKKDNRYSSKWSVSEEELWEDEEFFGAAALGDRLPTRGLVWLRPTELSADPRFFGDSRMDASGRSGRRESDADSEGLEPYDAAPGRWAWRCGPLGAPAACAAAAALALTPRLLARAAPPALLRRARGRVAFTLWAAPDGWRRVLVDTRLPARARRLLAAASRAPHDYTLPLLEKALAKLVGSYAALRATPLPLVLRALSGAVLQDVPLAAPPPLLRRLLLTLLPRATLLVLHNRVPEETCVVTGLARVREAGGGTALVRLRGVGAPGAAGGAWTLGGACWRDLAPHDRELLQTRLTHSSDFWMSVEEVCRRWDRAALLHLGPEEWAGEPALRGRRAWRGAAARRGWLRGASAGGAPPAAAAAANPQFQLLLPRAALVVAALQQAGAAPTALRLFPLAGDAAPGRALGGAALRALRPLDGAAGAGAAAAMWRLPAGRYLLLPSSVRGRSARFLLRLLADRPAQLWEVDEDNLLLRPLQQLMPPDDAPVPLELQKAAAKLLKKPYTEEVRMEEAAAALRRACGGAAAAAWALAAAAAAAGGGGGGAAAVRAALLPGAAALAAEWRAAWRSAPATYHTRELLRRAGVAASNRVLRALAQRLVPRERLRRDAFLLALARIHLAHERYRIMNSCMKQNPFALEDIIVMTIYT